MIIGLIPDLRTSGLAWIAQTIGSSQVAAKFFSTRKRDYSRVFIEAGAFFVPAFL